MDVELLIIRAREISKEMPIHPGYSQDRGLNEIIAHPSSSHGEPIPIEEVLISLLSRLKRKLGQ